MLDFDRRQMLAGPALGLLWGVGSGTAARAMRLASLPPVDPLSLVDPQLRPLLIEELRKRLSSSPKLPRPDRYRSTASRKVVLPEGVRERTIAGTPGQPPVRIYVLGAVEAKANRPVILHIHGGGFVGGRAADSISSLQRLARAHDCVIVTVDYRLAPETRIQGSLEDTFAALQWLSSASAELGIDPGRVVVMGESSGGGHAALLAILARDRGNIPLRAQILTYPMLDDRTGSTRTVPPFIGTYVWQPEDNRYGWSSLLGMPAGSNAVPAGIVPGRVQRLDGLPPAFIGVGSIDLFMEEDIEYAKRLALAGVPCDFHLYSGAYHGFDIFVPDADCSRAFESARHVALQRAFH